MGKRVLRVGNARLFEPEDRLVNARFEQMGFANPEIISVDLWIARTKADGSLLGWDELLYRPGHEFAPAESCYRVNPIAVYREHPLVWEIASSNRCCARSIWALA
jgi:hypothetical protein